MARVTQFEDRPTYHLLRNAMAGGVVTAGNSTNVSFAFGGLGPTATAGANGVAVTWRNTDTGITPVVQVQAVGTGSAAAAIRFACVTAFGASSAGVVCVGGAGGTATATGQIHVAVFGQARNDFKTT